MSALYTMRYAGQTDVGGGALYIGKGIVVGVDIGDIRYHGTYLEKEGRLQVQVIMSATANGSTLVTGEILPAGQQLQIRADLPKHFADGTAQQISVDGRPVQVTFEKIGDIP